jgi:hypothetical protein
MKGLSHSMLEQTGSYQPFSVTLHQSDLGVCHVSNSVLSLVLKMAQIQFWFRFSLKLIWKDEETNNLWHLLF